MKNMKIKRIISPFILIAFLTVMSGCYQRTVPKQNDIQIQKQTLTKIKETFDFLVKNFNSNNPEVQKEWYEKYKRLIKMGKKCGFDFYFPEKAPVFCKYLLEEAGLTKRKKNFIGFTKGYSDEMLKRKNYTSGYPLIIFIVYPMDRVEGAKMVIDAALVRRILNVPVVLAFPYRDERLLFLAKYNEKVDELLFKKKAFPGCLISDISLRRSFWTNKVSLSRFFSVSKGKLFKVVCYLPMKNRPITLERDFPIFKSVYPCDYPVTSFYKGKKITGCILSEITEEKVASPVPMLLWLKKELDLRRKYSN